MSLATLLESHGWRPDTTFEKTWVSRDGYVFIAVDQEQKLTVTFFDQPIITISNSHADLGRLLARGLLSPEDCTVIHLMGYQ